MSFFDAEATVKALESDGFRFALRGGDYSIVDLPPVLRPELNALPLVVYRSEIVRYLRARSNSKLEEEKPVANEFTPEQVVERFDVSRMSNDEKRGLLRALEAQTQVGEVDAYAVAMGVASEKISRIPNRREALAILKRYQPTMYRQLVDELLERLAAAAGIVSIEHFRELADEWVRCYSETVGLVRPYIQKARRKS